MPNFLYRAMNPNGEIVDGAVSAADPRQASRFVDELGLTLIESVRLQSDKQTRSWRAFFDRAKPEDVTIFTRDLALLLRAGARINEALELLASDSDVGRLRDVVGEIRLRVISGESFAEALARYPALFPPMYVALIRVGEASGSLDNILDVLAGERARAEALKRKLSEAVRYPMFIFGAAGAVLIFFLLFVLPQFASVLKDFNAKVDPIVGMFLGLSTMLRENTDAVLITLLVAVLSAWLLLRQAGVRQSLWRALTSPPFVRQLLTAYRTAIFCRNLGLLLSSGVTLTTTLRILVDMMATTSASPAWHDAAERIRHGSKLSDALSDTGALPPMATRMLRLGDETGQLPLLSVRVGEFYETKLQRSLDRIVGIVGPAAIILISIVVGGLIVSIMTALMSVSQIVG